jgi:hypothetical protein
MRVYSVLLPVMFAAIALCPLDVAAQRPVSIGIAGGVTTTPNGRGEYGYGTGALGQLSVERTLVPGRLGLRADAFFHSFPRQTLGGVRSPRTSVPGASASLVLPLTRSGARLQPYLLAGGGTYRTELGGGSSPEWHFGLSGGGGLEFRVGTMRPFIESRLHRIFDGSTPRLAPVAIGLRF